MLPLSQMKNSFQTLLLGAGFGAAFLIGQCFPRAADANQTVGPNLDLVYQGQALDAQALDAQAAAAQAMGAQAMGAQTLGAQGRGPVNPAPRPATPPEVANAGNPGVNYMESSSTSSANGFLAVTGSYGMGTQVLYVIDTENRQLAVYEARGGSTEQRRIVMVGARRIDLDLQLPGYNDRSEYEYGDLEKLFNKRDKKDRSVKSGLERDKR
tara:strand:+ start:35230 stop:35862 length:633 start_codon:yes stop_codon:yes gene_type:complete